MPTTAEPIPAAVRLHHVPDWLRRRMLSRVKPPRYATDAAGALDATLRSIDEHPLSSWLDHWGSIPGDGGQRAFVSEPYGLTTDGLASVNKFCRLLDLNVTISAISEWNPGSTIRLTFTPKAEW